MIYSKLWLSRTVLTTLVVVPLGAIALLSATILLPALKNPESKIYTSKIGYPALQRFAGKAIAVQTLPVAVTTLADSVAAPGESVAMHQVEVRALVSGPVEKVYVAEGQRVHRGQPLFQIQQAPYQNAVDVARNNIASSEVTLKTLQKSVPQQLLRLKVNVAQAKQRLAFGKTQIQEISSLVDGEIKNSIENAEERLAIAEAKLQQVKSLADEGAVSKFQLYDSQDTLISRKKELTSAQKGAINRQFQLFSRQDFLTNLQSQVFSAEQKLVLTNSELERQITDARLKLEKDRLNLQNALRNLDNTVSYASTDGLVSQVNVESGELAAARTLSPYIVLSQNIVFKAYVDQTRLNTVKVGDSATVRLVAYPGHAYRGQVVQINPTVETNVVKPGKVGISQRYTYSVWVAVDGLHIPPGLQGYVQFAQGRKSLYIPESAVTHLSGGEGMVMVAEAGTAAVKRVKLGRIFDNQREVLKGLKPGEQIVLFPRALNPGDKLQAQSAAQ